MVLHHVNLAVIFPQEAAAKVLASHEPAVVLAKIDATEEKESVKEHGVSGFPTLKWFANGEASEYTGGRTEAELVAWVKKKTGPPARALTSVEELEEFKASADVVVVGTFLAANDPELEVFNEAASRKRRWCLVTLQGTTR